jgi:hypothetical protein
MLVVLDNQSGPEKPRESRDQWSIEGELRLEPGGGLHAYNRLCRGVLRKLRKLVLHTKLLIS